MPRRITRIHGVTALLICAIVAIVWTWPLAIRLSSRVPHDPGDPILNTWILWWNAEAVPLTQEWWDAPFLSPLRGGLALSEHLLGLSVFATPLQWVGASPIVAYNVSMLLSYALSAFFAYLLVFRLTGSKLAGACAAAAFGCAPYRAGHLAHIQVLTSQWMPAMLLGMHGYLDCQKCQDFKDCQDLKISAESGNKSWHYWQFWQSWQYRWLVVFGAAWLLQALSNGYYMLFLPVLIVLWILWFIDWRREPRRGVMLVAVWIAASLPLLPILLKYHAVHTAQGLSRTLGEIRDFSASLKSFTYPPPMLEFWAPGFGRSAEDHLFPGVVIVALTVGGLLTIVFRRQLREAVTTRSPLLFYAAVAVLMACLALGPGGSPDGPASLARPYTWLMWLPGYNGLRVPSRFAMLAQLSLAVAGSVALAAIVRRGALWRSALAAVAIAAVAAEGVMERVPLAPPPQRLLLDGMSNVSVIEIPTDDPRVGAAAMYRAMFHRRPLISGYTGHSPYHYGILSLALWRGDTSVLFYLARERPLAIVVNYEADPGGGFRKMIAEIPGIQEKGVSGAGSLFLLPRQPPREAPLTGSPLPASFTPSGHRRLTVDLGQTRSVTGVTFDLRRRYRDLAERILIEASDDGRTWREAWLGWTGEFALDAALRDPIVVPVRLPFNETQTRYLRLYPVEGWMQQELRVIGR